LYHLVADEYRNPADESDSGGVVGAFFGVFSAEGNLFAACPGSVAQQWINLAGSCTYRVGWYDLDFINHLNNVNFVKWMLEALPEETLGLQKVYRMDLLFLAEGNLNDEIDTEFQQLDEFTYLHRLVRYGDKKVLATGRTIWG
jgi:hypothetical protein